jgi:hypothetical protein
VLSQFFSGMQSTRINYAFLRIATTVQLKRDSLTRFDDKKEACLPGVYKFKNENIIKIKNKPYPGTSRTYYLSNKTIGNASFF